MEKVTDGEATEHPNVAFALPRHCLALIQPTDFGLRVFNPNTTIEDCVEVKVKDCIQNFQEEGNSVATNVHL